MIKENVLPFKLAITKETMTPFSGLALFGEFVRAIDLDIDVNRFFPAPGSVRGYSAWEHVHPLLLMLHGGGRALEGLRKIGADRGLLKLLGVKRTPSPDATGDWLRRNGLVGVKALDHVNRKLLKRSLRGDKQTGYTLDIDATGIKADKILAMWTYKHFKGYMPMTAYLAENGLMLAYEFREGNVSPNTENLEFYIKCKRSMPAGKRIAAFRADSAAYQGKLLDLLANDHVHYASRRANGRGYDRSHPDDSQ